MTRHRVKSLLSVSTTFIVAVVSTLASAADLGLVMNGDVELPTRFGSFPTDHPNGHPDAWHYSTNAAWSNGTTDPFISPTHSLYTPDNNAGGLADVHEEHRSFATGIPGAGTPGRTFVVSWNWDWNITSAPGDMFSATVRISKAPAVILDLVGAITDHLFLTDGTASSGGFQFFTASIPLAPDDRSFDIIFRTRDNVGTASETGVIFVDDIRADVVPEPATTALLAAAALSWLGVKRRRRC